MVAVSNPYCSHERFRAFAKQGETEFPPLIFFSTETFRKIFNNKLQRPLSIFLILYNRMDVPFTFFGTMRLFKFAFFVLFRKFFNVSKGSPSFFLTCNKLDLATGFSKSPKGPFPILGIVRFSKMIIFRLKIWFSD